MSSPIRAFVLTALASLTWACASPILPSGARTPDALSSFLVWSAADAHPGTSADGTPVDIIDVRGGEVIRIETPDNHVLRVGQRVSGTQGSAESWIVNTPQSSTVFVRVSALTVALLLPRGVAQSVHRGHGSDPGYHWFALEDRVLAWAEGPFGAPFPQIAPPERIDYGRFADLDRALARAAASSGRDVDLAAAHAIRVVSGLRVVRALRPATGLPYFYDSPVPIPAAAQTGPAERPIYAAHAGQPLTMAVTGPGILHVWIRSPENAREADPDVRVWEGARLRASARLAARHLPLTSRGGSPLPGSTRARDALIHVPPGEHHYRIETSGAALISPLLAKPVVHWEDASRKDEVRQLEIARRACEDGGAPAICALALALLGLDAEQPPAGDAVWAQAINRSPATTAVLAAALANGSGDPTLELDGDGSLGSALPLQTLSQAITRSVDEATRLAWVHATTHGTDWEVADQSERDSRWQSAQSDGPVSCITNGALDLPELTSAATEHLTQPWHGVPTVELLVVSDCSDQKPIELLVDGQRLVANPSAPLVRWRIRVRRNTAKISRLDSGRAHVFAGGTTRAGCVVHPVALAAPRLATFRPDFQFGPGVEAVGLELWLRAGAARAEVQVAADNASGAMGGFVRLTAPSSPGLTAYDPSGVLWTRVGRLGLPGWAKRGIRVTGNEDVAVRPLVRATRVSSNDVPRGSAAPGVPADEQALTLLTRQILGAPHAERGTLYLKRALLLAASGARDAAFADARAAQQLLAPNHSDALQLTSAALRQHAPAIDPLPRGVDAYGIEADFDASAVNCEARPNARQELEQSFARSNQTHGVPSPFDVAWALQASRLHGQLPLDPRSGLLLSRALAGSRWKLRKADTDAPRVRRLKETHTEEPLDPEGRLRPRVAVGARFAPGTYASVLPSHPATAAIAWPYANNQLRVQIACAARDPAVAGTSCPFALELDGERLPVSFGTDGQAEVALPESHKGHGALVSLLRDEPGDWVALIRLVTDRPGPGTMPLGDGTWAIVPRSSEPRTLLRAGAELRLNITAPTLLRIEARTEGTAAATLAVVVNGSEQEVPTSGAGVALALSDTDRATLRARGGPISFTIAERVALDRGLEPDATATVAREEQRGSTPNQPHLRLDPSPDAATAGWLDVAKRSPEPLTRLQASLGTFVAKTGFAIGNLHPVPTSSAWTDAYAFNLVGYRRRVEALGLWTFAEVFTRIRSGKPTYGVQGLLYEDLEKQHIRITTSLTAETQQVAGLEGRSLMSNGFVEYSYRAAENLFMLPRLGYDGMYSSVPRQPSSLSFVDDEVYNPYRARRPTFLFGQALFWYAPYFNEITYLQLRGTFDAKARAYSHSSAVVGAFVAFGDLDLSGRARALWYIPRDSLTGTAHWETSGGATARYSLWSSFGSLAVVPGIAADIRPQDGGWRVSAFIDLFASYRRGLRDFSSLDLDFPEQLGGGMPWRGATPGGYQ